MLPSRDRFRVKTTVIGEVTVLKVFGNLDLVTLPGFETAVDALMAARPKHAIFDLLDAEFISGAGYEAIGQCSLAVKRVSVRSKNGSAKQMLRRLGYDGIVSFRGGAPNRRGHLVGIWVRDPEDKTSIDNSQEQCADIRAEINGSPDHKGTQNYLPSTRRGPALKLIRGPYEGPPAKEVDHSGAS